jgi:hypothetical protein
MVVQLGLNRLKGKFHFIRRRPVVVLCAKATFYYVFHPIPYPLFLQAKVSIDKFRVKVPIDFMIDRAGSRWKRQFNLQKTDHGNFHKSTLTSHLGGKVGAPHESFAAFILILQSIDSVYSTNPFHLNIMKGNRNYALFDSESDDSDHDDIDIMNLDNEKFNQSVERMKIDDDSDDEDKDDDSDDDDKTVDISLPEEHKEATDIVAHAPVKTNEPSQCGSNVSLLASSDDSSQEEKDLPDKKPDAKSVITSLQIGKKYNILDESSSSSSDDGSFDDFIKKTLKKNRDGQNVSKNRMIVPPAKKGHVKGRGAGSPPPRCIQFQNELTDDLTDSSVDSLKEENASKIGWAYNKTQREYAITGAKNMPALCLPSKLYDMLYDFQKYGVRWMAGLHVDKVGGNTPALVFHFPKLLFLLNISHQLQYLLS